MADKPSYLGLLNAISIAEGEAECYLSAWAATTPHEGVRQVISTVALREGEHAKAFAKRINELGFSVLPKANSDVEAKMAIAGSCELSDKEKFERLGVGREQNDDAPDIFANMLADKSIDIQTGGLLGRYIAEERDSGRMLKACYDQVCAETNGNGNGHGADRLSGQLSRIEKLLEQLLTR
jgi:rubrerythrin